MYWINFLHIYQPIDQSREVLKRVVNESYRPLFKGFLSTPGAKINLNINGALSELLIREGYNDVIKDIKKLAQNKKLEFTETAKYHPLLPFLKKEDIVRQVEENRKTNKKYFGEEYKPFCFFPPELAYNQKVGEVLSEMGYQMIILDEVSFDGGNNYPLPNQLFQIKKTNNLLAVFRERRISNCIMSAIVRNQKDFYDLIKDDLNKDIYLCTAMDGETFGHHRPGMEKNLFKILTVKNPRQIFFSELIKIFPARKTIAPVSATWASSKEDIEKGIQFYSWKDPKNKVHRLQWNFLNYLLKLADKNLLLNIQEKVDRAMASDQFFWASGEPWWSVEMVEKGAWNVFGALKNIPDISDLQIKKGEDYYKNILATAFQWQRSGKIEEKAKKYKEKVQIPFKARTLEDGKPEVYFAFIKIMKEKIKQAVKNENFEKAILWRDAIWKLETKNDIYDAMHVIDLLRTDVPDLKITQLMDKYKEKYQKIKPGQPEIRKI